MALDPGALKEVPRWRAPDGVNLGGRRTSNRRATRERWRLPIPSSDRGKRDGSED